MLVVFAILAKRSKTGTPRSSSRRGADLSIPTDIDWISSCAAAPPPPLSVRETFRNRRRETAREDSEGPARAGATFGGLVGVGVGVVVVGCATTQESQQRVALLQRSAIEGLDPAGKKRSR